MDYSLLVGIHDVDRAEQEEMDVEGGGGDDDDYEADGMGGGPMTGSFGTPPDSPGNPLNFGGFFGPGEFDPSVDVYAIKSHDGKFRRLLMSTDSLLCLFTLDFWICPMCRLLHVYCMFNTFCHTFFFSLLFMQVFL